MNLMKRLLAMALALCVMMSLAACSGDGGDETTAPNETTAPVETTAPAEETTEPADDGMVDYTVTVTDENGNPIAGALVQLCMDTCYPGATDESGVASFHVAEADYKVSFLSLPEGYTYIGEDEEFYFDAGSTALTIALKAAE